MSVTKILLVDDDELVTMSLQMILQSDPDIEVVGTGSSGAEGIRFFQEQEPDLVLMDIRMQDMTGLEAAEAILNLQPEAKILFLTTFSDDEYIVKALQLGVKGYLLKQDYKSIATSIHAVMDGQNVFGGIVVDKIPELMGNSGKTYDYASCGVSEKEYEMIQLVAQGLSNKEISDKTFLSEGTVKNYISTVLDKLNLRDRTQLAVFYLTHK